MLGLDNYPWGLEQLLKREETISPNALYDLHCKHGFPLRKDCDIPASLEHNEVKSTGDLMTGSSHLET
jgi:hypothetical protein